MIAFIALGEPLIRIEIIALLMCIMGVLLIVRPPILFSWASDWVDVGQGSYVVDYNGYIDVTIGTAFQTQIVFFKFIY